MLDSQVSAGQHVVESRPDPEPRAGEVETISTGSRVVCHYHAPCERCFSCTAGQANLCDEPKFFMGFQNDGGFADVVGVPAECAVPLPPALDFASAAPVASASTTAVWRIETGDYDGKTVIDMES